MVDGGWLMDRDGPAGWTMAGGGGSGGAMAAIAVMNYWSL